jgi:Carboxypeptidase regulatory-like domain/TonB dependent receptor
MRLKWAFVLLAIFIGVGLAATGFAQSTNSGDIRGTVTDTSGGLLPDVTVTVTNIATGVSKAYTTNQDGLYDTSSIVVGNYEITFAKDGFSKFERSSITVSVGITMVNARLTVGSVSQSIVVSSENIPLLTTTDAEQSTTFDAKTMRELPLVGSPTVDWENYTTLMPGTTTTSSYTYGATGIENVSANGNLPYSSMLNDGASAVLAQSGNANALIFETIQEVKASTSAFSSQYGVGGIIFNQITKGGTDSFHGAAYEYWQNDALDARSYFNLKTVPLLRYNNFGGSIGGPILKKKLFFFFDYDQIIDHTQGSGFETEPTLAMRAGNFTGQQTIYDPTTQTVVQTPIGPKVSRTSFASEYGNGNVIPSNLFDSTAAALANYFPLPNVPGTTINGITTNNFYYQVAHTAPMMSYFGRVDYNITSGNRITFSITQRHSPSALTPGDGNCPVSCYTGETSRTNAQVSDVWNINPTTINEARVGYTGEDITDTSSTLNQGFPAKLGMPYSKYDIFPNVNVTALSGLTIGTDAAFRQHVFDPSDVVTMIRGKQVLHFGGELLMYESNSTPWNNINGSTVGFTGAYTESTVGDSSTGVAYADFLLGQTQSWSASVSPEYAARQKGPQMFIQDDYQLRPNLTINLGLRYQIQTGWTDATKNQRVFDPAIPNSATGTLGAMWYAQTAANGRTGLQATIYDTFLPRVGFAYQPHPDVVIRGGWGLYAYNWSLDSYGVGEGQAFSSSGNITDQTNGISPVLLLSGSGSNLPYNAPTTSPIAFNGQSVSYNQYHTPVPKIYQWNLELQKELGPNLSATMAYVASHGVNLSFPVDINQIPEAHLSPQDIAFRPYSQYQAVSGSTNNAISNYNSLQITVQKRLTHGVSFNANYVWSHFLDDMDSGSQNGRGGVQQYQNSYKPSANYGASNFDIRNAVKGTLIYRLPFGKGEMFLNDNQLADQIVGGWRMSADFILQGGNPFTPVIAGPNNSYSQAGNWYPNVVRNAQNGPRTLKQWFNSCTILASGALSTPGCTPAWAVPTAATFGDSARNSLIGPGFTSFNASLAKSFHIWERVNLETSISAVNVINHPSFGPPNANVNQGGGVISTTTVGGRTMQLSARLSY